MNIYIYLSMKLERKDTLFEIGITEEQIASKSTGGHG